MSYKRPKNIETTGALQGALQWVFKLRPISPRIGLEFTSSKFVSPLASAIIDLFFESPYGHETELMPYRAPEG